jgi:hypothetical protein
MEPQSTPNTPIGACQDRLDALSKQIVGCVLSGGITARPPSYRDEHFSLIDV